MLIREIRIVVKFVLVGVGVVVVKFNLKGRHVENIYLLQLAQ